MARPKVLGNYAKLSASYYRDDAILEAGERAELLYVRGLAYCSEAMSDGFISDRQLIAVVGIGMRDAAKRASSLVNVGVWERVEGGYVVTSWLRWNKSAEEIGAALRRDRERKAHPDPPGTPLDSERIPDGIRADSDPLVSTRQDKTVGTATAAAVDATGQPAAAPINAGVLVAEWIDTCRRRPPERIVGQMSREFRVLLEEGFDPDDIRAGLATWMSKDVAPSVLPSMVNQIVNARPKQPSAAVGVEPQPKTRGSGWGFMDAPEGEVA